MEGKASRLNKKQKITVLRLALASLLECAELNNDDLEPETREVISFARRMMDKTKGD